MYCYSYRKITQDKEKRKINAEKEEDKAYCSKQQCTVDKIGNARRAGKRKQIRSIQYTKGTSIVGPAVKNKTMADQKKKKKLLNNEEQEGKLERTRLCIYNTDPLIVVTITITEYHYFSLL